MRQVELLEEMQTLCLRRSDTALINVGGLSVNCQRVNKLRAPYAYCDVGGRPELTRARTGRQARSAVVVPNDITLINIIGLMLEIT